MSTDIYKGDFRESKMLPYPADNRKFELRPASPEEAGLFHALWYKS